MAHGGTVAPGGPAQPLRGALPAGDGHSVIVFEVRRGGCAADAVRFAPEPAPAGWRGWAVDVPVVAPVEGHVRVHGGEVRDVAAAAIDRTRPVRFWTYRGFGIRVRLPLEWDHPDVPGGVLVSLRWTRPIRPRSRMPSPAGTRGRAVRHRVTRRFSGGAAPGPP